MVQRGDYAVSHISRVSIKSPVIAGGMTSIMASSDECLKINPFCF